jgi:hypothetical protein
MTACAAKGYNSFDDAEMLRSYLQVSWSILASNEASPDLQAPAATVRNPVSDLHQTVRDVADFLDIPAGENIIAEVCRQSTFEYMKQAASKFRIGKLIPWRPEGAMIRRGVQGGSLELLTPERQRQVDMHFIAELKRLQSDFPYADFCDLAT